MTSTIRSVTTLLPWAAVSYLKWRLTTVRRPKRLIMISSPTLGNTSGTSSGQRYSSGTCSSFLDVTRTMAFMMGKGYHTAPRHWWFNRSCCALTHRDSIRHHAARGHGAGLWISHARSRRSCSCNPFVTQTCRSYNFATHVPILFPGMYVMRITHTCIRRHINPGPSSPTI
jgi:hypothetical protein